MRRNFKVPIKKEITLASSGDIESSPTIETVDFILRHDQEPVGAYWNAYTAKGKTFSVVDLKTLFKSHPHGFSRNYFSFWEAIELDSGELLSENLYRASNAQELAAIINKL